MEPDQIVDPRHLDATVDEQRLEGLLGRQMRVEAGDAIRDLVVSRDHFCCSELFARLAAPPRRDVVLRRPVAHVLLGPLEQASSTASRSRPSEPRTP